MVLAEFAHLGLKVPLALLDHQDLQVFPGSPVIEAKMECQAKPAHLVHQELPDLQVLMVDPDLKDQQVNLAKAEEKVNRDRKELLANLVFLDLPDLPVLRELMAKLERLARKDHLELRVKTDLQEHQDLKALRDLRAKTLNIAHVPNVPVVHLWPRFKPTLQLINMAMSFISD